MSSDYSEVLRATADVVDDVQELGYDVADVHHADNDDRIRVQLTMDVPLEDVQEPSGEPTREATGEDVQDDVDELVDVDELAAVPYVSTDRAQQAKEALGAEPEPSDDVQDEDLEASIDENESAAEETAADGGRAVDDLGGAAYGPGSYEGAP